MTNRCDEPNKKLTNGCLTPRVWGTKELTDFRVTSFGQLLSYQSGHQNHLQELENKDRLLDPIPRLSDSVVLGWGISKSFQVTLILLAGDTL